MGPVWVVLWQKRIWCFRWTSWGFHRARWCEQGSLVLPISSIEHIHTLASSQVFSVVGTVRTTWATFFQRNLVIVWRVVLEMRFHQTRFFRMVSTRFSEQGGYHCSHCHETNIQGKLPVSLFSSDLCRSITFNFHQETQVNFCDCFVQLPIMRK